MQIVAGAKTMIDQVVASPSATAAVSAPPLVVSTTSLFGVTWANWMYISASVYSLLLIAGVLWKWASIFRRWLKRPQQ